MESLSKGGQKRSTPNSMKLQIAGTQLGLESVTSLPCAPDTGDKNPCIDTQDGLKASDCGQLGRQAAGHPWSALHVGKSLPKSLPNGLGAAEDKAAALHPGTRAYYLNYLQEVAG